MLLQSSQRKSLVLCFDVILAYFFFGGFGLMLIIASYSFILDFGSNVLLFNLHSPLRIELCWMSIGHLLHVTALFKAWLDGVAPQAQDSDSHT